MHTQPVLQEPHTTLRARAKPIPADEIQSPRIKKLIETMIATMQKEHGVGLAAPQIGESRALIVVQPDEETPPAIYINPRLTWNSPDQHLLDEGCLSVKGKWGQVKRARRVHLKALNEKGEKVKMKASGIVAHILQHEVDHLHGTLFIDKAEHTYAIPKK